MNHRNGFGAGSGPERVVEIGTGPVQGQGFNPQATPGGYPGPAFPPQLEGLRYPPGVQQPFFDDMGPGSSDMYLNGGGTNSFMSPSGLATRGDMRNGRPFGGRSGPRQLTPQESTFKSQQEPQDISDQVCAPAASYSSVVQAWLACTCMHTCGAWLADMWACNTVPDWMLMSTKGPLTPCTHAVPKHYHV